MKGSTITYARATPVRVPAKPDSLNSEGIRDDDVSFALKFRTGSRWPDFPLEIKWIIEIEAQVGTRGIGETYRGVEPKSVADALKVLVGLDVLSMDWRRMPVQDIRVYDAVESAVMDLAGKLLQVAVYQLLGGACRDRVECAGRTGRRTPEDAARKAHEAMERGFFKFKCSDADPVRAWIDQIKERCGSGIRALLDPNQRWKNVETTLRLMEGVDRDSMYGLEDAVDHSDFAGFRELRERLKIPIFLHIALPYGERAEDIVTALRERCVDGFNFNGPMFAFVKLTELAALDGLPCWHGSEVDLGILEASALHACAAAPGCTLPCDLFGESVRVDDLTEEPIHFERGQAIVPGGPGLGIELDRSALERFRAGPSIEHKA